MPAESVAQQEKFGAELARREKGEEPRMKASTKVVREFASTKRKGLPQRVTKRK